MRLKTKNYLYIIFLAGLVLRLLGLININLGGDFEYHWSVAGSIAGGENLPLLGPAASINPAFHLGPFYYYFLAIPYFLGAGNFKIAIIFFSLVNSFSIILLYKLSNEWFSQSKSLKIASLYAFSSYMINIGNFPWNANLVPLMVMLILYLLIKVKKGYFHNVVPLGLIYSLALQAHATFVLLSPFVLLQIPIKKMTSSPLFKAGFTFLKKDDISGSIHPHSKGRGILETVIKPRYAVISIILFILALMPWLIAQFQLDFNPIRQVTSSVFGQNNQVCRFSEWLADHGHGERCFHYFRNTLFIFRLFSMSLFANMSFITVILTMVLSVFTLITVKIRQKETYILWLGSIFFLYLFYSANIYLHYMLILIPLPFFIFVLFLGKIEKYFQNGKILSKLVLFATIAYNLIHYFVSLGLIRS